MAEQSVDFVYLADQLPSFSMPGNLKQLYNFTTWNQLLDKRNCHPLFSLQEYIDSSEKDISLNIVQVSFQDVCTELFNSLQVDHTLVFLLQTSEEHGMADQRQFFHFLMESGLETPVIIKRSYREFHGEMISELESASIQLQNFQLHAATDVGALLIDGFGDGIWLDAPHIDTKVVVSTSFGILQATRSRISKTEYISCPSCGRTLFDLQETTQLIRSRTSHLKGVKIAIMGCIVNGPGEMADADYGYVGTGPGKITLYRGKEVVKKSVNTEFALDELISIIREDGIWIDAAQE
jgi:(E)-4-hydroxy-3-methylbut-2-enyl-diphosphate synthase